MYMHMHMKMPHLRTREGGGGIFTPVLGDGEQQAHVEQCLLPAAQLVQTRSPLTAAASPAAPDGAHAEARGASGALLAERLCHAHGVH